MKLDARTHKEDGMKAETEAVSNTQREPFQEWSNFRIQQIKNVVTWELERLSRELHEQVVVGVPRLSASSILGPASRQTRVPRISECEAELPKFDSEAAGARGPEQNPLPASGDADKVKRNSFRKQTPHAGTLLLSDVWSETNSEASPEFREQDASMAAFGERRQGSMASRFSQETQALEPVGSTSSEASPKAQGAGQPSLEQIVLVADDDDDDDIGVSPPSPLPLPGALGVSPSRPSSGPSLADKSRTKSLYASTRPPQTRLGRWVTSQCFDIFYSMCIIVNCLTMGLQADALVNDYGEGVTWAVFVIENILVGLFAFEIFARLKVYGLRYFSLKTAEGVMNLFDAIIVMISGIIFGWMLPLVTWMTGSEFDTGFGRALSVFRALRLLRIVRVIQQVPMFREVWLLLRGLTSSLRTLIWTVAVIFVLTYIFAILGCWLISSEMKALFKDTTDEAELDRLSSTYKYVQGVGPLMQLLIQFLTLDSWNDKMERIMVYTPWCLGYFYMYIAVAVFVLMNLVTAIIVENAMSASRMDENQRLKQMEDIKRKELKELEQLFYLMDADGDGTLDWEEFENAFLDEEMSRKWRLLDFEPEECKELFDLLDDGDGGIETKEFFHGLARMKGGAQSRDLMRVTQKVDRLGKDLNGLNSLLILAGLNLTESRSNASFALSTADDRAGRRAASGGDSQELKPIKKARKSMKSPKVSLEEAKRELQSKMKQAKDYSSDASSGARSFL